MMPNIHLLRCLGCSCGFLRAGGLNGTGMSCPVSVSLSTGELSWGNSICSHRHSPVTHLLFAGRGYLSEDASHGSQLTALLLPALPRAPCCCSGSHSLRAGQQSLPGFQWSRGQGKPLTQPEATGPHAGSLLPLSLAARQTRKGTPGLGQGTKGSEPGDRGYRRQHHHEGSWILTEQETAGKPTCSFIPTTCS